MPEHYRTLNVLCNSNLTWHTGLFRPMNVYLKVQDGKMCLFRDIAWKILPFLRVIGLFCSRMFSECSYLSARQIIADIRDPQGHKGMEEVRLYYY